MVALLVPVALVLGAVVDEVVDELDGVHGVLLGLGLLAFLRLGLGLDALLAAEYAAAVDGGQDLGLVPRGLFLARAGLGVGLSIPGGLRFSLVLRLVLLPGRGLMGLFRLRGGGLRRGVGALPLLRLLHAEYLVELVKIILHFLEFSQVTCLPRRAYYGSDGANRRRHRPERSDSSPRPPPARGRARVNHIARRKVD